MSVTGHNKDVEIDVEGVMEGSEGQVLLWACLTLSFDKDAPICQLETRVLRLVLQLGIDLEQLAQVKFVFDMASSSMGLTSGKYEASNLPDWLATRGGAAGATGLEVLV